MKVFKPILRALSFLTGKRWSASCSKSSADVATAVATAPSRTDAEAGNAVSPAAVQVVAKGRRRVGGPISVTCERGSNSEREEKELVSEMGIWHPKAHRKYLDLTEYLNWYNWRRDTSFTEDAPVIGLVLQHAHLTSHFEYHSGIVTQLEDLGAKVIPVFCGGQDFSTAITKFFVAPPGCGKCFVNSIVVLTRLRQMGGPVHPGVKHTRDALRMLNVPYMVAPPDPEDGKKATRFSESLAAATGERRQLVRATSHERWWVQQQEQQQLRRIDAISGRAISWAQLSQKEASNKKLAIICYPNTGASDFGQIHRLVKDLQAQGFNCGSISKEERVQKRFIRAKEVRFQSSKLNVAYQRDAGYLCPCSEVDYSGLLGDMSHEEQHLAYGMRFGNVFFDLQPACGEVSPQRQFWSDSSSAEPGSAAQGTDLRRIFQADVVLHVGTKCSLERAIGKGLSPPDAFVPESFSDGIPRICSSSGDNPKKAAPASRRLCAAAVLSLTPILENAASPQIFKEREELHPSYQIGCEAGRGAICFGNLGRHGVLIESDIVTPVTTFQSRETSEITAITETSTSRAQAGCVQHVDVCPLLDSMWFGGITI